mmetsp:Transcript_37689/g.88160  ORF Transcript_37689/g.88160 Transcript_37689/m.88160 type:complete len:343 (-) Transcript_37689:150-1178(-)
MPRGKGACLRHELEITDVLCHTAPGPPPARNLRPQSAYGLNVSSTKARAEAARERKRPSSAVTTCPWRHDYRPRGDELIETSPTVEHAAGRPTASRPVVSLAATAAQGPMAAMHKGRSCRRTVASFPKGVLHGSVECGPGTPGRLVDGTRRAQSASAGRALQTRVYEAGYPPARVSHGAAASHQVAHYNPIYHRSTLYTFSVDGFTREQGDGDELMCSVSDADFLFEGALSPAGKQQRLAFVERANYCAPSRDGAGMSGFLHTWKRHSKAYHKHDRAISRSMDRTLNHAEGFNRRGYGTSFLTKTVPRGCEWPGFGSIQGRSSGTGAHRLPYPGQKAPAYSF